MTVHYALDNAVATITLDDGKVNALSPAMQAAIHEALDKAEADQAIVVIAGRDGRFSGGFDLATISAGGPDAMNMVKGGFLLSERLLQFPKPVVFACTGHAIAMGLFLLISGDFVVGADGPFKLQANEVAIGLPMPFAAIEICRNRLTPAVLNRAINNAEIFTPSSALAAGFVDQLTDPDDVVKVAEGIAAGYGALDMNAHAITKKKMRANALTALRGAIESEFGA